MFELKVVICGDQRNLNQLGFDNVKNRIFIWRLVLLHFLSVKIVEENTLELRKTFSFNPDVKLL